MTAPHSSLIRGSLPDQITASHFCKLLLLMQFCAGLLFGLAGLAEMRIEAGPHRRMFASRAGNPILLMFL